METENTDKTKEIELLQEAMRGMVNFKLSKGDVLKIGTIAGGVGVLGMAVYGEVRGWFLKRKLKKQMDAFTNGS